MQEIPRSSFIPKQSGSAIPAIIRRRRKFSVFSFIATLIFITSLVVAFGTYYYKGTTERRLDEAKKALSEEETKLGPDRLKEVRDFNRQLLAARFLLDQHLAPTKIFKVLEQTTMQRVRFEGFSFEYDPANRDAMVTLQGSTEEFKTVALQGDRYEDQPILAESIFSEFALIGAGSIPEEGIANANPKQSVSFAVSGEIPIETLKYEGRVGQEETKQATEMVDNPE